ncbi:DUF4238 domain-containing protein [Sinorhizobium meliloti]|nr:DUF4238 domain-containing protein [Sinorhizobium meliloti]
MPENKLQHYVPKCHLRPFASGEAINLYNIISGRLVENAPIRGQCARNYFYGKDGILERGLQIWEGEYASAVAKAVHDPDSLVESDLAAILEFALLQTFRTYGYVEKLLATSDKQHADLQAASSGLPLPPRMLNNVGEAVNMSISHFLKMRKHVADLDVCILLNKSRRRFVTSDDPAIHTNRFHFQRLKSESFGFSSAGAILFLPLTPTLGFMAFDGNVYIAEGRRGNVVTVIRDAEITALNELQMLHARQNIYYGDAATGRVVASEFPQFSRNRPEDWTRLTYFEKVGESERHERYGQVDALTIAPGKEHITALQMVHVRPSRWSDVLKFRLRPRTVDTGSGAGVVRPDHPVLVEMAARRAVRPSKQILASFAKF